MTKMKIQYRVTFVESERGWGQKAEYIYFDTRKDAEKFRDKINAQNTETIVPDYYTYVNPDITIVEVEDKS